MSSNEDDWLADDALDGPTSTSGLSATAGVGTRHREEPEEEEEEEEDELVADEWGQHDHDAVMAEIDDQLAGGAGGDDSHRKVRVLSIVEG